MTERERESGYIIQLLLYLGATTTRPSHNAVQETNPWHWVSSRRSCSRPHWHPCMCNCPHGRPARSQYSESCCAGRASECWHPAAAQPVAHCSTMLCWRGHLRVPRRKSPDSSRPHKAANYLEVAPVLVALWSKIKRNNNKMNFKMEQSKQISFPRTQVKLEKLRDVWIGPIFIQI